ncbi:MAG: ABC transporter permease [Ignavibacteriaceae bacterium]|nr:ABC transporter permease [Ignavibacteriaceae bacterium]
MLSILLFFPAFLLMIFGYAINFDVQNVKLAVYDRDKSSLSREFINTITSTPYFELAGIIENENEIKQTLDKKSAQCIIVIPQNLSSEYYAKRKVSIQFLIDGVDGNTAVIVQNYLNAALSEFNSKKMDLTLSSFGINQYTPIKIEPRFWYNPELKTTKFLIPGLIAMILVITAVISVSLSLVREKERGTIEQINVSPIQSLELLLGKTAPYLLLALLNAAMILVVGYLLFDVEVKGSMLLLFASTLLFLFACTSIGILVSSIADTMQVAFSISTFASLLPSVILSGFIFPIESMPNIIQVFTNITPTKFFIVILRAIILRGVGLEAFWLQIIYLIVFAVIMLALSNVVLIKKEKTTHV